AAWLAYPRECGRLLEMNQIGYNHALRREILRISKETHSMISWPANVLRHSAISAMLALEGNIAQLSREVGTDAKTALYRANEHECGRRMVRGTASSGR